MSSLANVGSRFLVMLLAAHLLPPFDIGLYAIVNLVLGFAYTLASGGLMQGIIARRDVAPDQLSSLFWFNLLFGIGVSVPFALAAPILASFYEQPRLLGMLLLAAINLFVYPLGQTSQALLQKHLHFRSLTLVELAANGLNCLCAIAMLYGGVGIYALIVSQLAATCVRSFLLRVCCRDFPRLRLRLNFAEIAPIVKFGLFQTGSGVVNYLGNRLDQFMIGALLGPQALGYYAMAWLLIVEPVYRINPIITSVAFPIFAQRQDDLAALKRGFHIVIKFLTTIMAPFVCGFAAIAPNAIPAVLGERWTPSVVLVELLSVVAIARTINNPVGSLVLAVGRADKAFYWTVAYYVVQAPFYAACLAIGGLVPATVFLCATNAAVVYLAHVYLLRPIFGPMFIEQVKAFLPAVILAVAMAVAVRLLSIFELGSTVGLLAAQVLLGIAVYGAGTFVFRRGDLGQLVDLAFLRNQAKPLA